MASRQCLESKEAAQGELSVFGIFHPSAGAPRVIFSEAPQDPSLSGGIPASDDGGIQLHGDRDKIKGRASARHGDARDGHGSKDGKVPFFSPLVVELKGGYSLRYNL